MSRRFWLTLFTAGLLLYGVSRQNISRAANLASGSSGSPSFLAQNQTIPTRTSTPGPTTPSSPVPPTATQSGGGGENPTAVPTSTLIPSATATLPPTLVFTPVSGFIPTAAPCSNQPTIQTQNPTNIRSGPGSEYAIVTTLAFLEVRPIIGRAADAPWWWIQVSAGETGWVADEVVTVQGYIGSVPRVIAPERNGHTPTPGAPWQPTLSPLCTVTPTTTAAITASATIPATAATTAPVVTGENAADTAPVTANAITPTVENNNPAIAQAANPPLPTQTAVSPPTLAPTVPPAGQNEPVGAETAVSPAAPLDDAPAASAADLLLLAAGILLLAAGVIAFISRKRAQNGGA